MCAGSATSSGTGWPRSRRRQIGRLLREQVGDREREHVRAVEVEQVSEARDRGADQPAIADAPREQLVYLRTDGAEPVAALEVARLWALRDDRRTVRGILDELAPAHARAWRATSVTPSSTRTTRSSVASVIVRLTSFGGTE